MKITQLTVGKTFNTGNYTSLRLDMTAEIAEGDDLKRVRMEMESQLDDLAKMNSSEYKKAKQILNNMDDYTGKQIRWAQDYIERMDK